MDAPDDGFAQARRIALGHEAEAATAPPGTWLLEEAYLKPFAGVRHAHYGAAAAIFVNTARGAGGHGCRAQRGAAWAISASRFSSTAMLAFCWSLIR